MQSSQELAINHELSRILAEGGSVFTSILLSFVILQLYIDHIDFVNKNTFMFMLSCTFESPMTINWLERAFIYTGLNAFWIEQMINIE